MDPYPYTSLKADLLEVLQHHYGDLAKVDRWEACREAVTDILDESKTKEGDIFVFTDEGDDVAVEVSLNVLRFARYVLDILEAD